MTVRKLLSDKKRIIVKVGSSTLVHPETGNMYLGRIERLIRALCDIKNAGRDVVLVSSGAIAVGRKAMHINERPKNTAQKQALAAIGQATLMTVYRKIFAEYNQQTAQVLLTKNTMLSEESRTNACNTFKELLDMGVIPIVNENDTVATHEIEFGDNDRLSAIVTALIEGDLLILLTDIDGLYTADPNCKPDACLIPLVEEITDECLELASDHSGSDIGTGGMVTKLAAARIATNAGADMIIANGSNPMNLSRVLAGEEIGTLFLAHKNKDFDLFTYIKEI